MTKARDIVRDKLRSSNFKNKLKILEGHIEEFTEEELVEIFEELRLIKVDNAEAIEKFNLLDFLIWHLKLQYGIKFSISEMVYILLNEGEQEHFLKIIDTSSYPYIKLDFEADEVRRRVWENKLYFDFYCGNVVELELYYNSSNANILKENLRRLKKFQSLRKLNLLFFCGYPNNLIRTRVAALKTFGSLKKVKIYEFEEGSPIPVRVKLR